MSSAAQTPGPLAARLLDALPQTQCTRCGYPDCAAYADAIAAGVADINQCPPGGQEGVARLARITGRPEKSLDPAFGLEAPRQVVFIDENWCIGCTLCLDACPTDAIMGSNKRMHTVIEPYCTGCELCLPVCPVDCIHLEPASGDTTGWTAWSQPQADLARTRYAAKTLRGQRTKTEHDQKLQAEAQAKLADLASHSRITDPKVLDHKRAIIEAAMARARAKREADTAKD
ncbi:MAG: electron transport complex subunit RsxB [Pseudomonadota bacterium]